MGGLKSILGALLLVPLTSAALAQETPRFSRCVWVERTPSDDTAESFQPAEKISRLELKSTRAADAPRAVCGGDAECEVELTGAATPRLRFTAVLENVICESASKGCPTATACVEQSGALAEVTAASSESGGVRKADAPREEEGHR